MSESDKAPDAAFDEELAIEDASDHGEQASAGGESRGRGGRVFLNFFAATVAIILLPSVAYLLWTDLTADAPPPSNEETVAKLVTELAAVQNSLRSMEQRINDAQSRDEALAADIEAQLESLNDARPDRAEILGNLPGRLSTLERNVASLKGVSASTRDAWLLAEAEYYLQLGNAQLQLAGNPELAAAALREADKRLVDVANPAYLEVREAIADELTRLDLSNNVDIGGLSMTLASLSRVVDALPVRRQDGAEETDGDVIIDPDMSGPKRAWETVKQTFSEVVRVSKIDDENSPLLTPDAEVLLRANLSLQLQAARLALLKGEREIFKQSMEDADSWLATYFDTSSVQVQSARETIDEISGNPAMQQYPDISESLRLLRQTRTLEDAAE